MTEFKLYTKRIPDDVRARLLEEGEVVYSGLDYEPLQFHPGDVLVEPIGRHTRYVISPTLFHQIYMEVNPPDDDRQEHASHVSQTVLPDIL